MADRREKRAFYKRIPRNLLFYSLLLAFPIAQFCIFYLGVNVNSVLLAFKTYTDSGTYEFWGMGNFDRLFASFSQLTLFQVALGNSLVLFIVGTSFGLICGLFFSYYIYKRAFLGGFFKVILFLPSIIPSIALVLMFKQIADSALPAVFSSIGIDIRGLLSNPDTTFGTIIFYNIWVSFGVSILLYAGAMDRIPESVVEAAKLDGAGYMREFVSITLPLIFDTVSTFIIVAVGGIFVNQANIYAFFSDGAEEYVYTIGYYLYRETVKTTAFADYPMLSAFGLLLSLVTVALVYTVKYLLNRLSPIAERKVNDAKV